MPQPGKIHAIDIMMDGFQAPYCNKYYLWGLLADLRYYLFLISADRYHFSLTNDISGPPVIFHLHRKKILIYKTLRIPKVSGFLVFYVHCSALLLHDFSDGNAIAGNDAERVGTLRQV